MSASLNRAISNDIKIKLGSLVAPSWRRTQSEGETLELLLAIHFPNPVRTADIEVCGTAKTISGMCVVPQISQVSPPDNEVHYFQSYLLTSQAACLDVLLNLNYTFSPHWPHVTKITTQ
jgi:hypothetical protein